MTFALIPSIADCISMQMEFIPAKVGTEACGVPSVWDSRYSSHVAILQEVKCSQEAHYIESFLCEQLVVLSILAWIPIFMGMKL